MQSLKTCAWCSKSFEFRSTCGLCPVCFATELRPIGTLAVPAPRVVCSPDDTSSDKSGGSVPFAMPVSDLPVHQSSLPHAPAGYEVLTRLGGGGMGDVYLAREQASARLVAMKLLRYCTSTGDLERFLLELRTLAKLEHPNIVRLFASDFLRSVPYFTMEYVEGHTLADLLRTKAMQPGEAVRIIRAVADAVVAAHTANIIHRDLKPSNILLTADGTPKVADFGLAKQTDLEVSMTQVSGALGTPSYMPPEQISRKNGEVGPWSDVYGLGATLYHMLAGHAPFISDTKEEIIPLVLLEPPARLRALRPDILAELEGIVLKCLEKDPKDRYQTVAEFAADIDRFTAGQKPVAPPLTRFRRTKRWARANRRAVATFAVALGLSLCTFVLGAAFTPTPQSAPPEVKPDVREEIRKTLVAGREVVLIGESGEPRWHKWHHGAAAFAKSPLGDDSCTYETVDTTLLELLDDPGIDHYRIRGQLRQTLGLGNGNGIAAEARMDRIGVYFGHARTEGRATPLGDNATVDSMFAVTFLDHDPNFIKTGKVEPQTVQLERRFYLRFPGESLRTGTDIYSNVRFLPPPFRPGPWRSVQIDVTPTDIRVWWLSENNDLIPFRTRNQDDPVVSYSQLQTILKKMVPGNSITIPKWSPRMPFGILCSRSAISVRNVIISPLPKPQG